MVDTPTRQDTLIDKLKGARKNPAVLKAQLVILRGKRPNCLVFAFEGDTDKAVYVQWVRRIRPTLQYEPFPCDGKTQVFELRDMLERDLAGLRNGVFFFVDRDFDDLRGHALGQATFMTDRYSVENYLVASDVLDELLKDEFHCHGEPTVRAEVIALFERQLEAFLSVTRDVNFRIFVAKRLKIRMINNIPDKIKAIASIGLDRVEPTENSAEQIIRLAHEPSEDERVELRAEFDQFDAKQRFRGKFSFGFFMKWLELLAQDRNIETSKLFHGLDRPRTVNYSGLSLGMLASKSSLPPDLLNFVAAISAPDQLVPKFAT